MEMAINIISHEKDVVKRALSDDVTKRKLKTEVTKLKSNEKNFKQNVITKTNSVNDERRVTQKKNIRVCKKAVGVVLLKQECDDRDKLLQKCEEEKEEVTSNKVTAAERSSKKKIKEKTLFEKQVNHVHTKKFKTVIRKSKKFSEDAWWVESKTTKYVLKKK